MAMQKCEDMNFAVSLHIGIQKGNTARAKELKDRVSFSYDPNTYGNGFYMYVKHENSDELFDIRYDVDFDHNNAIAYVLAFYANRYNGKNGAWKLTGIHVYEADFEVMDS